MPSGKCSPPCPLWEKGGNFAHLKPFLFPLNLVYLTEYSCLIFLKDLIIMMLKSEVMKC